METDEKEAGEQADASKQAKEDPKAAAPSKEPEATSYKLENPSRVAPGQRKFVAWEEGARWKPIQSGHPISGILVVKDTRSGAVTFYC